MNITPHPTIWRPGWLLTIIGILTITYGAVVSHQSHLLQEAKEENKFLHQKILTLEKEVSKLK